MRSNIFIKKLIQNDIIKEEEIEIYYFGIQCLILKTIIFLSYLTIATLMFILKEFVVIMLVFIPLRRSSGGYHARTKLGCYFVSCGVLIVTLLMYKGIANIFIWTVLLVGENIIIIFLAPVDNEKKKMDKQERYFFKLKTRKIVACCDFICMLLLMLDLEGLYRCIVSGMWIVSYLLVSGRVSSILKKFNDDNIKELNLYKSCRNLDS